MKYIFKLPDHSVSFDLDYVYNRYDELETKREDSNLEKSIDNSSFLNLMIKFRIETSFIDNDNSQTGIEALEKISNNIENYYNKINFIEAVNNDVSYMRVSKEKNIENKLKKFMTSSLNYDVLKNNNDLKDNYSINYMKENKEKLKSFLGKSVFSKKMLESEIDNEETKFSNTDDNDSFDLNMVPYRRLDSYRNNKKYISHVGFLVEKFSNDSFLGREFILNRNKIRNYPGLHVQFKDKNVNYGKTYTYKVYPVFNLSITASDDYHIENQYLLCGSGVSKSVECVKSVKPHEPQALTAVFDKKSNNLKLKWSYPLNTRNDIKGYFIFKRFSIEEPYQLIGVINFSHENDIYNTLDDPRIDVLPSNIIKRNITEFIDKDFNLNKMSIYSCVSYDAHGKFSNYSDQTAVIYNFVKNDIMQNSISLKGAPLNRPNIFIDKRNKFFNNDVDIETILPKIKDRQKLTLYCTPDFIKVKRLNGRIENVLSENYVLNIFKLENSKDFTDIVQVKNFNNQ